MGVWVFNSWLLKRKFFLQVLVNRELTTTVTPSTANNDVKLWVILLAVFVPIVVILTVIVLVNCYRNTVHKKMQLHVSVLKIVLLLLIFLNHYKINSYSRFEKHHCKLELLVYRYNHYNYTVTVFGFDLWLI